MPAYHISSLETACEAPLPPRKAKQMLTLHFCSFLKPSHQPPQQKPRKRGTPSCSLLTNSVWTSCLYPNLSSPVLSHSLCLLRFCLFYQCLTHLLTDGPGVTWARLPLVKTSVGSLLPRGHTSSSIATLLRMTNFQHQLEGNRVKKQTKIIPTDRAGSILTFCKWFPFIKAAHEWLVVVGCTLYLPNTPTAFWTHLIKK